MTQPEQTEHPFFKCLGELVHSQSRCVFCRCLSVHMLQVGHMCGAKTLIQADELTGMC